MPRTYEIAESLDRGAVSSARSESDGKLLFLTEASTIGIAPGAWPRVLVYEGIEFPWKRNEFTHERELVSVIYEHEHARFEVLND